MYNNFRSDKIKDENSPDILKFIFEIITSCRCDYPATATGPRQCFTMLSAWNAGSIITGYLSCFCFSPSLTLAKHLLWLSFNYYSGIHLHSSQCPCIGLCLLFSKQRGDRNDDGGASWTNQ